MKRHLKSAAQLLLIWLALMATLAVAAALLAEFDPLSQIQFIGARNST